jgi:hypothetical protein
MKSLLRFTLILFMAAFLFSSCSKKNEEGKMIPKDAMFVLHLDTKSLRQKLPWDDIKQSNWYHTLLQEFQKENGNTNEGIKKIFENPENTGIDLDGGLVLFAQKESGNDHDAIVEGLVKDAKNFEQFNKYIDSSSVIKTDGDLKMLTLHRNCVVAWNDKHFVYAINPHSAASSFTGLTDSSQNNMAPLVDNAVALSQVCKNLFSLKSDSSLADNEKFTDLIKESGEVHTWINAEQITKNSSGLGMLGMLGMLKLDVFLKDNISTYTVSFDNGKISIKQKGYAGKEFSDFLQKYSGDNINSDMLKNIPSQDVTGVFAMNFKPEGLKELIKLTGMDGMLNGQISQMGFNLDDFVKDNKGDIMFTVTDFKMKKDSFSYKDENGNTTSSTSFSRPDANYLFSVAIGNKPSFQKLVEAGKKIGNEMRTDTSVSFGQNDKLFAISNHQSFVNQYLAGSSNKFDFIDKLTGHPIAFYIDIHKILSVLSGEKKDPNDELIMNESLKLWNNISYTGGEFKQGGMTGTIEINFVDQNTNSLKQLNHYFDEIAKVEMAKKEARDNSETKTDSIIAPPAIDTVGH